MPVVCAAASSHVDVHGPGILQETVLVPWPVLPLRAIMVSKEHIVAEGCVDVHVCTARGDHAEVCGLC